MIGDREFGVRFLVTIKDLMEYYYERGWYGVGFYFDWWLVVFGI